MTSTAPMEPLPLPAGALRVIRQRTTTAPAAAYVQATTAHCPYLAPSLRHGLTHWTVYGMRPLAEHTDVEADVFSAALAAAERVRIGAKGPRGHLVCENIVVAGADRAHLDWPHWALKHLLAPVGLMVGKFWEGETDTDRNGDDLPVPPLTFLSVRPAVRPRDPQFLDTTPTLADTIREADDDGRDLLAGLSHHWTEIRAWASTLPFPQQPARPPKPPAGPST
ncbi:DUF6875 domain-containing protein [Streptomyces sp. JL7001]|uniref:DUF6875 domain-containing protein n=1 Tax=Streptomyces sp. JL7001 TaxID=3445784 RepID=UPI003F795AB4